MPEVADASPLAPSFDVHLGSAMPVIILFNGLSHAA